MLDRILAGQEEVFVMVSHSAQHRAPFPPFFERRSVVLSVFALVSIVSMAMWFHVLGDVTLSDGRIVYHFTAAAVDDAPITIVVHTIWRQGWGSSIMPASVCWVPPPLCTL